ncbi:MAG TPA: tetratricopeptide repeat protein [Vicinamibacterales bacterium]|nr:tetratricopeptide repeat protein [Vicinamibacterales bacterium]
MTRRILVGIVLLAGVALAWVHGRSDAPLAAADASAACRVALAPASGSTDIGREIARARDGARREVRAKQALERLGQLYVSRARISNDPRDYTLAEAAAGCLEARYPGEASALLLRGHVLHQLHRFSEAEQLAHALVARRSYVLDYGLLGDVLLEQGRLDEAAEAYQRMMDLKPFYQSYTRAAHLRWLRGNLDGAIEAVRLAIASASPRDPELSAWAWTRLSSYQLQAGRLDEAADAAETALAHQPDYAAALEAQGRILLARNRTSDAIAVLQRASQSSGEPDVQWLLADALRLQGREGEAGLVERDLTTRGALLDPRTVALYLATRRLEPTRAVALAEKELRARRDIFTLDAHAWALAASDRFAEAGDVMARALAAGTSDARLFLHAGIIHAAAGRSGEAARWLKRAHELRAMLYPSESALIAKHLNATEN